jgi:glycine/D-amino acid oxidase-like deaminating enzyme
VSGRADVWWHGAERSFAPLRDDIAANVCVVGGGFTGLWTALAIKRRSPDTDVVLLERRRCGAGASGRNGGLVVSYLRELPKLVRHLGDDGASEVLTQSYRAIDEVGEWAAENAPGAGWANPGYLWCSLAPAQDGAWRAALAEADRLGIDPRARELQVEEARARVPSPRLRSALLCAEGSSVDPGRLVAGLVAAATRAGVRIFEDSPAARLRPGEARVDCAAGSVRADRVVLATGPWSARVGALRRQILPVSSQVLVTAPVPELERTWRRRTVMTDARLMVHYAQVTPDLRLVFGRGGGAFGPWGRVTARLEADRAAEAELREDLRTLFPGLAGARVEAAWGGAVDRSARGLPFVTALDRSGRWLAGAGFSGKGIAPTYMAGQVLASLSLGADDELSRHPFAQPQTVAFPPEPLRTFGGVLVRRGVRSKEAREQDGRAAHPAARALAGLAWFAVPARNRNHRSIEEARGA